MWSNRIEQYGRWEVERRPGPALPGAGGVLPAVRAMRLRAAEIGFIAHPSFDEPGRRREILGPGPGPEGGEVAGRPGDAPLLGREQEFHLFRRMNYLRYRADRLRRRIDPRRPRASALDRVEALVAAAEEVRDRLIRANLGLVAAVARKFAGPTRDLQDLIGEGYLPLIRAVDRFNYGRGFRFSTYATRAIANHLARLARVEWRRHGWLVSGGEDLGATAFDHRADEPGRTRAVGQARAVVHGLLARLGERERRILVGRFGLGDLGEQTLAQLGVQLGISKERVRQIEHDARRKLGRMALAERSEALPA